MNIEGVIHPVHKNNKPREKKEMYAKDIDLTVESKAKKLSVKNTVT